MRPLPLLVALTSLLLFACSDAAESPDTSASSSSTTQANLEAATDECFEGCMARFGDNAEAAECAEICASIGGDRCQEGCEARGGDASDCEARCAEATERDQGDWRQECYEGCLERGADAETCREACAERDQDGERTDDATSEDDNERSECEEGEERARGDVTYVCRGGEWVEVTD